ncbi:hypothetical protein SAMN04487850_0134 [Prevotella aff. ruminicola Tc2-24]|uniref:Uncharacterized protein n=1 Tax=Prevotella aff. ruminicola Tc2-24 TaxID=81582 RepID=A0A1I0LZ34_9BACT|nr:hypothetical protein SAMN04487850_0134 [Prevotella aff. ruminicola Tc2-24]
MAESFDKNLTVFILSILNFAYSYSFSAFAPVYQFGLDLIFFVQNYIISLFCANECCTL